MREMRRAMAHGFMVIALAIGVTSCAEGCSDDSDVAVPHVDVYAIDDETRVFAGREDDVPFPALADGTSLRTPREHEQSLARFVTTVTLPDARRILIGARDVDDSFVRTFLVVVPAAIGTEHVARAAARPNGVVLTFDEQGRASMATLARSGKRVAFAIDGRVVFAPIPTSADEKSVLVPRGNDVRDR